MIQKLSRRNLFLLVGILLLAGSAGTLAWIKHKKDEAARHAATTGPLVQPVFVIRPEATPDAVIVSQNLAELPKDLLQLPLFKEILTEDVIFYYQDAPDVHSLVGSLKRIAFEHQVTLADRLLASLFSGPAEIALWRSATGRLEEGLLLLPGAAKDLLKIAATVAPRDSQLKVAAEPAVKAWPDTVYRYEFRPGRALYLTAWKDRLAVFTHPQIPQPQESTLSAVMEAKPADARHRIYLSMDLLSFGYQHFLASFPTVKFSYRAGESWQAAALTEGKSEAFAPEALWSVLPQKAALCFAATVDKAKAGDLIQDALGPQATLGKQVLDGLQNPLAICWYEDSRMYTPLLVAKAAGPLDLKALKTVFEYGVGNTEAGNPSPEERAALSKQEEAIANGETVDDPVKIKTHFPPLPVQEQKLGAATIWTRPVSSRYGLISADNHPAQEKMRSKRYFEVTLASVEGYLIFSPDHQLAQKAIAVLNKKYPALTDTFTSPPRAGLLVFPKSLAELLRQTTLESLPAEQEAVFRASVAKHMFPALDRFKNFPATAFIWPEAQKSSAHFEDLKWQSLSVR